jgi:DNA mismatch repair protein MutL
VSDIIHLLPDSVANQIAAGEVIQRPSSVLKELVENAIDAGATEISIVIKDAGRTLIQITDNGKGMSETDARMAFERHATSKINNAADLFSLHTLGFRGEALASIAAVAQVELHTRRQDNELGIFIEIAGSRMFKQEATQTAVGSTFAVKNLFFNVPARRRFLKSDTVERNHLLQEFYRIALVYNEVEFAYYDGSELIYQLPAANVKTRIEQIFGKSAKKKWEQQLLNIEVNSTLVSIRGFIGRPEFSQRIANQYFFVNGRYMRHPYFHKAVMLAYDRLLQTNQNPNYFIYFDIAPENIDINIHPTKTEIKFENEQAVFSILQSAVKETLGKFNIVPSIDFDVEGAPQIPVNQSFENIRPPQVSYNPAYNPFQSLGSGKYKRPPMQDWEKLYSGFENEKKADEKPFDFENTAINSIEKETADLQFDENELKTENFQLKGKYILTSLKSGLLVIDQQRAHTRILFDQFMKQLNNAPAASQQVMFPEELRLVADEVLFFRQMLPDLAEVGFDIQEIEENVFEIRGIPSAHNSSSTTGLLLAMLDKSQQIESNAVSDLHETIALSLAEASTIKAGQSLTPPEMSNLIDSLFACPEHTYTPDGKRILTIISFDEIEDRMK